MVTTFTGKKDAIRFRVIGGSHLIEVFTHMACYRCAMCAHILHFFQDGGPVFIRQSQ
jgi:hypothetical protein